MQKSARTEAPATLLRRCDGNVNGSLTELADRRSSSVAERNIESGGVLFLPDWQSLGNKTHLAIASAYAGCYVFS